MQVLNKLLECVNIYYVFSIQYSPAPKYKATLVKKYRCIWLKPNTLTLFDQFSLIFGDEGSMSLVAGSCHLHPP
jgi:hypothetical protein